MTAFGLARALMVRQARWATAAAVLAILAAAEIGARPLMAQRLVESSVVTHDPTRAAATAGQWILLLVAGLGVAVASQLVSAVMTERVLRDMRVAVVDHELRHLADLDDAGLGRAVNDTTLAAEQLAGILPMAATATLEVAASLAALAHVDPQVAAAVLAVTSALFVPLTLRYRRQAADAMMRFLTAYDTMSAALTEAAAAAPMAWRYGRPDLAQRFQPANHSLGAAYRHLMRLSARYTPAVALLRGTAYATALIVAVTVVPVPARIGVITASLVALPSLLSSLSVISMVIDSLTIGTAALTRLARLDLRFAASATSAPRHHEPSGSLDLLAADAVRRYDGFAVGPVSVSIGSGVTAIVGRTGAGKTTLARLLAGIDHPTSGTVTAAGRAPAEERAAGHLMMLPQQPHLFPGTLADSLNLARNQPATHAELESLIEGTGLDDWLNHFPRGLATTVDDTLSEGDRQILALLQVLLRDPAVVILDEPTATLDPLTSNRLEEAAMRIFTGRTVIVVTHRPETAERAGRVLVIDEGQLVADGTHETLLHRSPAYRALWQQV